MPGISHLSANDPNYVQIFRKLFKQTARVKNSLENLTDFVLLEAEGECGLAAASRKSRTVAGGEGPEFPAIPLLFRAKFSAVADAAAAGGLVFGWYELKYD